MAILLESLCQSRVWRFGWVIKTSKNTKNHIKTIYCALQLKTNVPTCFFKKSISKLEKWIGLEWRYV